MKEIQISRRLQNVAAFVQEGKQLADVGCDHGYIPIYLLQKKKIEKAIAMDINQGPLMRAKEHIQEWGLENYIDTRLSDGVKALKPNEVQSVVIAGMGGPLMEKILTEGNEVLQTVTELVLQPQSEIGHFRRFLIENGYEITHEEMILEDGKYYPIMRVVHGKTEEQTEAEYLYGKKLLQNRNPVLKEFLDREQVKAEELLEKLRKSQTPSAKARISQLEKEWKDRKEALAYYDV